MKLIAKQGYYKFYPEFIGEVKLWENANGVKLYQERDFWTFSQLKELPNYSFIGHRIAGLNIAIVNYAGLPEEVLSKNKLTYCVSLGTIVPRATMVLKQITISQGAYMSCKGLPQLYALSGLEQIEGFEAFIDVRLNRYKIERFFDEDI